MHGKCHSCGCKLEGRNGSKHTAKYNFLKNVRQHYLKKHKSSMIAKSKRTRENNTHNPSIQDLAEALQEGGRAALEVVKEWNEGQYANAKMFMDGFSTVLPPDVMIVWKMIEAVHDGFKKLTSR